MTNFVDCNSKTRLIMLEATAIDDIIEISEKQFIEELEKSIASGLIPDLEKGIFVREGYGALVGEVPSNCKNLEELLKFTEDDFGRKVVTGKPETIEEWRKKWGYSKDVAKAMQMSFPFIEAQSPPLFHHYNHLISEKGYDLVIGPGCSVHGETWGRAVYCRNYLQVLDDEREGQNKEQSGFGKSSGK